MNRNVTFIDELPFLDDLETQNAVGMKGGARSNGMAMIPNSELNQIQKFIRNNEYNPPAESGMTGNPQQKVIQQKVIQQMQTQKQPQLQQMQQQMVHASQFQNEMIEMPIQYPQPQQQIQPQYIYQTIEPNCVNVADHTANCIVCSRLYNNDKSIYVVIIMILTIICILLLKRVLNV